MPNRPRRISNHRVGTSAAEDPEEFQGHEFETEDDPDCDGHDEAPDDVEGEFFDRDDEC